MDTQAAAAARPGSHPPPSLTDLPDDLLSDILARCGCRALVCAASTCRLLRDLAARQRALPLVALTCDRMGVLRWLLTPANAERVRSLVARRCLYGRAQWTARLTSLRALTLSFCRMRSDVFEALPPSLIDLEIHQVVPPWGCTHARVCMKRLRALRRARLVFSRQWEAVFVGGLPRGLRQLHVRCAGEALIMESFMPRGLRDVNLESQAMLLGSNRLPGGVRSLRLSCAAGRVWLKDTLPLSLRRLERLEIRSPMACWLHHRLPEMTRLRRLALQTNTFVADWAALAALPALEDLEIRAREWLGFADARWPAGGRGLPARLALSVGDIAVPMATTAAAARETAAAEEDPETFSVGV